MHSRFVVPLVSTLVSIMLGAGCSSAGSSSTADCKGDAVVCGGACIELKSDNLNCGACGTACAAGKVCSAGACAETCSTGLSACPTASPTYCADTLKDANNCGSCGTVCESGTACSSGECVTSCPTGEYACSGTCADPKSDPAYCGAASDCTGGAACGPSASCYQGRCEPLCDAEQIMCNSTCIDPQTDHTYCGASGYCAGAAAGTTCLAAQTCVAGACTPVCSWQQASAYDLTSAPVGLVQKNGGIGGQGPATVNGRTAWSQTSDWNMLFVPTSLAPTDDVFAVEADVYIGTPTSTPWFANQMLFTTTGTASGPNGTCQAIGGLYSALVARSGSASTSEWWTSAACPYAQMTTTSLAATPSGQWHRYRVEGVRSTCHFRALLDGSLMSSWAGTCDMSGGYFALYAHAYALGNAIQVAWSNMTIYKGNTAVCVP